MNFTTLTELILLLPEVSAQHARTTRLYALLEKLVASVTQESGFAQGRAGSDEMGEFGRVHLPYYRMGAVDTLDLFGLDELIIFSYYLANRSRYRRAADIGANVGLHSILMSRLGWAVTAFEPDPTHASVLEKNLSLNEAAGVTLVRAAVSDRAGEMEFVRVLGNTTSSHLAGAKSSPYGELERFPVRVHPIREIMANADFVKMDAEGQEKIILLGTEAEDWTNTDMMLEVGSPENAAAIFDALPRLGVNAFAQKTGWSRVRSLADMPASYKHGSLFITRAESMRW